jgi:hypothetical protein
MRNLNKKNIIYKLMSGNRANASAIQRRTNNPPPVRSTTSSSRYSPPPPPQVNPKLSFSDAIALITIRLGRVETFINQLPPLDQLESFSSSHTEESENNLSLVNDNVFQSIITRLERLEKSQNTNIDKKVSELDQKISLSENGNVQKILTLEKLTSSLEEKILLLQNKYDIPLTKEINTTEIDNKINFLSTQIDQLKDTVLSLQTYTMNTNTKLIDLIITNTELNENQDDDNEDITKHLENLFRQNLESEINNENDSELFEKTLNDESTIINNLKLNEDDLSNLSINI